MNYVATKSESQPKVSYVDNEPAFRWTLLQDQMAFDKLHEGIKKVRFSLAPVDLFD